MSGINCALFVSLLIVAFNQAAVIFDNSMVLSDSDLKPTLEMRFNCVDICRVYSPSNTPHIAITDTHGKVLYILGQLSQNGGKPVTLNAGNYTLNCLNCSDNFVPEFVFYLVQKQSVHFDTQVIINTGQVGLANKRFLTFLTDEPGFLIQEISGDLRNVTILATGGDTLGNEAFRPVFAGRSSDNAARSSIGIRGPIATIDFGSSKANHFATFSADFNTIIAAVGSSSVYVSPGYVGGSDEQEYNTPYLNRIQKSFSVRDETGICVRLDGVHEFSSKLSQVEFTINEEILTFTGNGSVNNYFTGNSFNIGVNWKRTYSEYEQFSFQLDLMPIAYC